MLNKERWKKEIRDATKAQRHEGLVEMLFSINHFTVTGKCHG
jgi:hypothetical protein